LEAWLWDVKENGRSVLRATQKKELSTYLCNNKKLPFALWDVKKENCRSFFKGSKKENNQPTCAMIKKEKQQLTCKKEDAAICHSGM